MSQVPGLPNIPGPGQSNGQYKTVPLPSPSTAPGSGLSLWQFGLALLTLYLIMRYVPRGEIIGLAILTAALVSTPDAVTAFVNLLDFIQYGTVAATPQPARNNDREIA